MKKTFLTLAAGLLTLASFAAETNSTPEQIEAKYTAAIEGRTADILKVLALSDAGKSAKVHDAIIAHYRALNAWHNENDAKLKAAKADTNATAQIRVSLKAGHGRILSSLTGTTHANPPPVEPPPDEKPEEPVVTAPPNAKSFRTRSMPI